MDDEVDGRLSGVVSDDGDAFRVFAAAASGVKGYVNGCTFSGFELAFAWGGSRTSTAGLDFSDDQRLFARIRQAEVILDFFAGFDFSVVIFCAVELGPRSFGQLRLSKLAKVLLNISRYVEGLLWFCRVVCLDFQDLIHEAIIIGGISIVFDFNLDGVFGLELIGGDGALGCYEGDFYVLRGIGEALQFDGLVAVVIDGYALGFLLVGFDCAEGDVVGGSEAEAA